MRISGRNFWKNFFSATYFFSKRYWQTTSPVVLCIGFVEIHKQCARSSADRVLGYEPIGRRFESSRARHEKSDCILQSLFSVIFISRREVLLCRDIRLCRVMFASRVKTANIISLSQRHSINIVFIDLCIAYNKRQRRHSEFLIYIGSIANKNCIANIFWPIENFVNRLFIFSGYFILRGVCISSLGNALGYSTPVLVLKLRIKRIVKTT